SYGILRCDLVSQENAMHIPRHEPLPIILEILLVEGTHDLLSDLVKNAHVAAPAPWAVLLRPLQIYLRPRPSAEHHRSLTEGRPCGGAVQRSVPLPEDASSSESGSA